MTDETKKPSDEPAKPQRDTPAPENAPEKEYKVGPRHPPKEHTWKKGAPTPNPTGRRGKSPSIEPDLRKLFVDVIIKKKLKITTKDQKQRLLSRLEMGLEQLGNQFAKGDRHARRDVFMFAEKLGVDLLAGARSTIEALAPDHQAILDAYVDRRTGNANGGSAAPVIAPPELLDDDATVSQSTPDPTASPAPTEPAPAKLPRTPQEIREARRLRFQKQAQFDAARAAELAAALCEPDTATKELPTSEPPVTPPPATAADSVVEPAPAPPAAPSTVTNASGAAPQGSSVEAKPPLAAPAIQLPDSVSTNPPPASEVPAPPTSPLDASPPDAPPPDPPPSVMQNPWRQGRKPTEKEKIDWALHINNRSAR